MVRAVVSECGVRINVGSILATSWTTVEVLKGDLPGNGATRRTSEREQVRRVGGQTGIEKLAVEDEEVRRSCNAGGRDQHPSK